MAFFNPQAIPLRRLLCIRLGLLVALSVMLLAAGTLIFVLLPLSEQLASHRFSAISSSLRASLDREFKPPELSLMLLLDQWQQTPPAVDDEHDFNRGAEPILRHFPQATSAVAGTSAGEGWMLLRQTDGSWLNRLSNPELRGDTQWFVERPGSGETRRYQGEKRYDPRLRQWYLQAVNKASVQWTEPYTFFTTGDPGITAAVYRPLKDGRALVVGIDLKLRDLSQTTQNARIGQRGFATILTEDLRVLALPGSANKPDEAALDKLLKNHRELGLVTLDTALATWQQSPGDEVFSLQAAGEPWFAQIAPYSLGQQRLWVVIMAPHKDFSPDWLKLGLMIASGLALLLLFSSYLSYLQARHIASPLEALVEASKRIGQLDFSDADIIQKAQLSSIAEVRALASAQDDMRRLLAANQQQIEAQAAELKQLAHHDSLTGLPNRGYFIDRLQQALQQAAREQAAVAVFFLDLDRFKEVNDSQGHEAGDFVLCEVARRFREVLRQNELLARIGGDEFAIVATRSDEASARRIASRLGQALATPIVCAESRFQLGVSIGISIYPANARNAEELLRTADIAMYQAKATDDGQESRYVIATTQANDASEAN